MAKKPSWIADAGLGPGKAQRCMLEPFVKLGRTVRRHLDGILAIFESRSLTNGPSEGINSVIQCAKARASGFRTIENMIAIVFLMTGDLADLPVSPYKNIKLSDRAMPKLRSRPAAARGGLHLIADIAAWQESSGRSPFRRRCCACPSSSRCRGRRARRRSGRRPCGRGSAPVRTFRRSASRP